MEEEEDFPRTEGPTISGRKSIEFQIIDWFIPEADKSQQHYNRLAGYPRSKYSIPKYDIVIYGVTDKGYSITCTVSGFKPYFYLKYPPKYTPMDLYNELTSKKVVRKKLNKMTKKYEEYETKLIPYVFLQEDDEHFRPDSIEVVDRKDYWGFTNRKNFKFFKITVESLGMYNVLKRWFSEKAQIDKGWKLYGSNIDPFFKFIHERKIEPCGWVKIPKNKYAVVQSNDEDSESENSEEVKAQQRYFRTSYTIEVSDPNDIIPLDYKKIAPLLIASFDIECTSSHGDFPVAKKDYRKLATDLIAAAKEDFTVFRQNLKEWLRECFTKDIIVNKNVTIHRVYRKKRTVIPEITDAIVSDIIKLICDIMKISNSTEEDDTESESDVIDSSDKTLIDYLSNKSGFPQLEGDQIIQIGTTVSRFGSDKILYRHLTSLNTTNRIDGIEVEWYNTEREVILGWKEFIQRLDPDVLTGYNIFGFDMKYIWERTEEIGEECNERFATSLGRQIDRRCILEKKELSSSALGENIMYYFDLDGVVMIDMLKVMQRDHKLDSYKLDFVAETFLKDKKDDLKPREIFEKFLGNSEDRAVIGKYCIQDCALCNRLLDKLKVIGNNIGMGNVCFVPLSYLFMRGQGIKIFSLVSRECHHAGYLIPVISSGFESKLVLDEDGYEGAIVLEPKCDLYLDDPITVFDYSSLYPSSMISRNLSHDSYVNDEEYANIEGIEYIDIEYDVYEGTGDKKRITGKKKCRFAQDQKGVLPTILINLLNNRKLTRKKIEYETLTLKDSRVVTGLISKNDKEEDIIDGDGNIKITDCESGESTLVAASDIVERKDTYNKFEQAVLDALQLAYKITANSLYGQTGSKFSQIYLKEIAACTTATGREMIYLAKNFMEENYGVEVVYGDSVMPYTPILLRNKISGEITSKTIDSISDEKWKAYDVFKAGESNRREKQQIEIEDYQAWTDNGWSDIKRVIKHKCNKSIFRILTHTGLVDVTEDHSLLTNTREIIKPVDLKVGAKLLCGFPKLNDNCNNNILLEEAYIYGFFVGDGSCGCYKYEKGTKDSWALNNSDLNLLNNCLKKLLIIYPNNKFKILNTIKSSGVYKLVPNDNEYGYIKELVEKYRRECYTDDKSKKIPSIILNSNIEIKEAFLEGLFDSDGCRNDNKKCGCHRIDTKNQITAQMYFMLLKSMNYNVSINSRTDKTNIYRITWTNKKLRKEENVIKKIEKIHESYDDYVYDIETEEGVFQAGIGNIIVKNTDSIFCKFPLDVPEEEKLKKAIELGIKAEKDIKVMFKKPGYQYQSLAYEKVLYPLVLITKKRYIGNLYEKDPTKYKEKSMGVVTKRRDNAPIVKIVYGGCIGKLLNERNLLLAIEFLQSKLQELIDGKIPLENLIISKTLKSTYKDPSKIAHKVLADRMGDRDIGNKPMVNDRLPYIYIKPANGIVPKLQGDRIEHPDYIRDNNLTPDYYHYITNQIMNPICQIFALCLTRLPGYSYPPEYWLQMDEELSGKDMYKDEKKREKRIQNLKIREVENLLFSKYLKQLEPIKTASKTKKTAVEIKELDHTLIIRSKEIKRGKEYSVEIILKDKEETELWKNSYEMKYTKEKSIARSTEKAFKHIVEKFENVKGLLIDVTKTEKKFAADWKSAMKKSNINKSLEDAIKDTDNEAVSDILEDRGYYENLIENYDRITYDWKIT